MAELKKSLTITEAIDILLEHDAICPVCNYSFDCTGGVSGGPNGPIYPPCSDGDYERLVDEEDAINLAEEFCNDV